MTKFDFAFDFESQHQFRNASELKRESKGGYLVGKIGFGEFPKDAVLERVVLSLVIISILYS
jgi:hypothetical protein